MVLIHNAKLLDYCIDKQRLHNARSDSTEMNAPAGKRVLERTLDATVFNNVVCKEYGVSLLIKEIFSVYGKALHKAFGDLGKSILAIAYCRFLYRCPLKNIPFRLMQSFLPEMPELDSFNEKTSSSILKTVGGNHQQMLSYMKSFIRKGEYFLMDVTNVLSNSMRISLSKIGYNNSLSYDKQFNLMYLYTAESHMPVYYRLLPGNIREVKAFKNCLIEAGLKKAIIVADKGFYSKKNIQLLQDEKLKYILPLKRDNEIIQYDAIIQNTFNQNDSFFEHENRIIWYRKYNVPGLTVFTYLWHNSLVN